MTHKMPNSMKYPHYTHYTVQELYLHTTHSGNTCLQDDKASETRLNLNRIATN